MSHPLPTSVTRRQRGSTTPTIEGLTAFVDRYGDRAAEVVWQAALTMIERAGADAREGQWGRWRFYPRGELRRLRRDVASALELARFAVALQEEDNAQRDELERELAEAAAEAGRRRRREMTRPAEEARLAKARARKR